MIRILALVLAFGLTSPALALDESAPVPPATADCPADASMQGLANELAKIGGKVIGGAIYDTPTGKTTVVIYTGMGSTFMVGFKDGCIASRPMMLETGVGEPTTQPQSYEPGDGA